MRGTGLFVCGCVLLIGTLAGLAYCSLLRDQSEKHGTAPAIPAQPRPNPPVLQPNAVTTETPAVSNRLAAPATAAALSESRVLRAANAFSDGGGFNWDNGSGAPEEIRFGGQKILSKAKRGTYCCGFTFAVVMRAAGEAGLLKGKSIAQIRKFQQHWYAATPQAREKQQIYALEWLRIGYEVPLMEAQPGDFLRLWHGASGHSVIFIRWIVENGKKVAIEYRGTQGSTNGIGNRIEYLPGAPGHPHGDFELERTYVGRLNDGASSGAALDAINKLIDDSPRYQQLRVISPHPGYFVEKSTRNYWIIAMGENMDDHFVRCETLRIWKTGLIEKLNVATAKNGDDWTIEYNPETRVPETKAMARTAG